MMRASHALHVSVRYIKLPRCHYGCGSHAGESDETKNKTTHTRHTQAYKYSIHLRKNNRNQIKRTRNGDAIKLLLISPTKTKESQEINGKRQKKLISF